MHAGAWADRHGRRRQLMIACDLGRFALLATVPVCWALGVLTLGHFRVVLRTKPEPPPVTTSAKSRRKAAKK